MTPQARFLRWPPAQPVIRCGRQSLYVFCAGVFLSFAAHFFLTEFSRSLATQLTVSAVGIGLMIALAYLLEWYRDAETSATKTAPSTPMSGAPGDT